MNELRKKALRAFFSIRRMVDTRALTTKTMLKLIDSLVKPVATYACQIWLPCTKMAKEMARADGSRQNLARAATKDALETTHLKMLKWVLGLHKKANNNFCYGDTGRLPWALSVLPQCLRYFDRLSQTSPDVSSVNFLVHQTFQEQKNLNLSWYETWNSIAQSESKAAKHAPTNQHRAEGTTSTAHWNLVDDFVNDWRTDLASQKKMQFYCTIKQVFGEEQYLNLKNSQCRMQIAKTRSSSHDLLIALLREGDTRKKLVRGREPADSAATRRPFKASKISPFSKEQSLKMKNTASLNVLCTTQRDFHCRTTLRVFCCSRNTELS